MALLNFLKPKWKSKKNSVREAVARNTSNQRILKKIALSDPYSYKTHPDFGNWHYPIREIAIAKIRDKFFLKELSRNNIFGIREAALDRLAELNGKTRKKKETDFSYLDDWEDPRLNFD